MNLEIKDPWTMPDLESCDEIIETLRARRGRYSLAKREFFPLALSNDPPAAIVEYEARHAVIYYTQILGEREIEKARVVNLPDRKSVQELMDHASREYWKKG